MFFLHYAHYVVVFLFVLLLRWRRCPLLSTLWSVSFCLLSLLFFLRPCPRFDLVWFRLFCDHGWIRSGSVNADFIKRSVLYSIYYCFIDKIL